jgi:hypothetical protein
LVDILINHSSVRSSWIAFLSRKMILTHRK